MSGVLQRVAAVFSNVSGTDPSKVTMDKHIFDDLGVDSLDFLDIVFDLDKEFAIKLPMEEWLSQVEEDQDKGKALFTVKNLVGYIEEHTALVK
jgi:acyl carrier protein